MPKIGFNSGDLRRGFGLAKLVKPKTGDFVLQVQDGVLTVVSYDDRKYARAEIRPRRVDDMDDNSAFDSDLEPGYVSDEFFLSDDRKTVLDTDLRQVHISITAKGINVKAHDGVAGGADRKAVIRKRPDNSRRPRVPKRLQASTGVLLKASVLEDILRHLSCSALVKETKTEDDMRINQVHFYSAYECAFSNARSHATVVKFPGLNLDSSIVSSDIPLIKGFCAKMGDKEVLFGQDDTHVFVQDPETKSCVFCARVSTKRPDFSFSGLEEDGFTTEMKVDGETLNNNIAWAVTAVEGTSRISIVTEPVPESTDRKVNVILSADGDGVARFFAHMQKDTGLVADFHIGCLSQISPYLTQGEAVLRFGHKSNPTLLDISTESIVTKVKVRHFIRSMKEKR